jgi:putative thioredoxin
VIHDSAILDVTDATFQAEVIERSATTAVVVDLWAPWCGPCKTLGPIIEKVIGEANAGAAEPRVVLVKVNVDENPQISAAFQAQSIPAVHGLKDGKVTASFVGAKPEADVKAFVDALLPAPAELDVGALLAAGDVDSLQKVLESDHGHPVAIPMLAELFVADGKHQGALDLLARIPETDETRRIAALARTGASAAEIEHDKVEVRLGELIDQVKGNDDARQEFVDLLTVLGPEHPSKSSWRRQLSTRLY